MNGFIVSGLGASPEQDYAYPPSLKDELKEVNTYMDKFVRTLRHVLAKSWDLLFAVLSATDWIQHAMWKYIDPEHPLYDPAESPRYRETFEEFWERVDETVGMAMDAACEETLVFAVSNHGFGQQTRCSIS